MVGHKHVMGPFERSEDQSVNRVFLDVLWGENTYSLIITHVLKSNFIVYFVLPCGENLTLMQRVPANSRAQPGGSLCANVWAGAKKKAREETKHRPTSLIVVI